MKSTLNNACISALLCGAVLLTVPAIAAGVGVGAGATTGAAGTSVGAGANTTGAMGNATANSHAAVGMSGTTAGASTSTGGMSTSGDINTTTAGNNAGSVNTAVQTPSGRMSRKATATANAAEAETTRQLNQQATVNASPNGVAGTAGATVQ